MKKLLKYSLLALVIIIPVTVGVVYSYINSDSCRQLIIDVIKNKSGIECSIGKHSISLGGDVEISDFAILDSNQNSAISISSISVDSSLTSILSGDVLPEQISVDEVELNLKVENGKWNLAILNEKSPLKPDQNFEVKLNQAFIILDKKSGMPDFSYLADVKVGTTVLAPWTEITNFHHKGLLSQKLVTVENTNFNIFGGSVVANGNIDLDLTAPMPVTNADVKVESNGVVLEEIKKLEPMLDDVKLGGDVNANITIGFLGAMPLSIDGVVSTEKEISVACPELEKLLQKTKQKRNYLVFKKVSSAFKLSGEHLVFSDLRLENDSFITLDAKGTDIFLKDQKQFLSFDIPLIIRTRYDSVKWDRYRLESDKEFVEIPLKLTGASDKIGKVSTDAVLALVEQYGIDKLNSKVKISVGGKELQINDILESVDVSTDGVNVDSGAIVDSLYKDADETKKAKRQGQVDAVNDAVNGDVNVDKLFDAFSGKDELIENMTDKEKEKLRKKQEKKDAIKGLLDSLF